MIRRVWLSLGSNQGDRWAHLSDTLSALREDSRVHQVRCSQVFETAPVGGPPQGRFLNCVVELVTDIAAHDVLELAHQLESAADRQRVERWGPRTLDVDIIAIEGEQHQCADLIVPHPRAQERAFVVVPLAELEDPEQVLHRPLAVPQEQLATVEPVAHDDYPRGWPS